MTGNSDGVHITLDGNLSDFIAFFQRISPYLPTEPATAITFLLEGKEITMLEMTDIDQAEVSLVIKDKNGKPASVDEPPPWTSSDTAVAEVTPTDATNMKAVIVAKGSGICQIMVEADADLGSGVKPLIGFLDVTVLGTATIIELVPGPITPQP